MSFPEILVLGIRLLCVLGPFFLVVGVAGVLVADAAPDAGGREAWGHPRLSARPVLSIRDLRAAAAAKPPLAGGRLAGPGCAAAAAAVAVFVAGCLTVSAAWRADEPHVFLGPAPVWLAPRQQGPEERIVLVWL